MIDDVIGHDTGVCNGHLPVQVGTDTVAGHQRRVQPGMATAQHIVVQRITHHQHLMWHNAAPQSLQRQLENGREGFSEIDRLQLRRAGQPLGQEAGFHRKPVLPWRCQVGIGHKHCAP